MHNSKHPAIFSRQVVLHTVVSSATDLALNVSTFQKIDEMHKCSNGPNFKSLTQLRD